MIELLIGAALLTIALTALLGAFLSQITLNEHARNLTWAINDANRVMERLRQLDTGSGCTTPGAKSPIGTTGDAWLTGITTSGGGGKRIQPNPATNELIVVTCLDNATASACGDANQVGTGEWSRQAGVTTTYDLIRVTVAVCWRHRNRTLGECTWNGAALAASDGSNKFTANGGIESPATLSTLMTCRQ